MFGTKAALVGAVAVGLVSTAAAFAAPPQKASQQKASQQKATVQKAPQQTKSQSPSASSRTALAIQGRSATFGPYSMKVGDGLNVRAKFGYTIWDKNKPNEVNMLNSENKVYYRDTAKGWLTWSRRGLPSIDVSSVDLVEKLTVDGQPCNHYFGYQMVNGQKVKVADFVCLQKAPCDQTVVEFWSKHYLVPAKCGFPVSVSQRAGNHMEIALLTTSIKTIPASTVSFSVPKDYKRTNDKASLYFAEVGGGLSKSDLESFFQQPLK